MPNKWTSDEELSLVNMLKHKKSLKEISRELNRTENAVEQRINKIIYENIKNSGKTPKMVAGALNMQVEDVNSYFKAREEFIKQKLKGLAKDVGLPVEKPVDVEQTVSTANSVLDGGSKKQKKEVPENSIDKKDMLLSKLEYENRFIKALIENKILHRQLNKLIKDGKIDPNIKLLLKQLKNK